LHRNSTQLSGTRSGVPSQTQGGGRLLRLGGTPRKEKNLCTSPSNQRSFSKQTRSGYELDDRVSAHIHRKAKQAARTALRRGKTRAHLLQAAAAPVGARFLPCPPPHATKKRGLQEAAATAEAFAGCREGGRSRPAPSRTRVTARPLRAHIEGSVHIFFVCLFARKRSVRRGEFGKRTDGGSL
jgi:hypothetical protein